MRARWWARCRGSRRRAGARVRAGEPARGRVQDAREGTPAPAHRARLLVHLALLRPRPLLPVRLGRAAAAEGQEDEREAGLQGLPPHGAAARGLPLEARPRRQVRTMIARALVLVAVATALVAPAH